MTYNSGRKTCIDLRVRSMMTAETTGYENVYEPQVLPRNPKRPTLRNRLRSKRVATDLDWHRITTAP